VRAKQDRAVLILKMKKLREGKIAEIDAQLLTLEEMVQTIEWETQSLQVSAAHARPRRLAPTRCSQVFDALKVGNKALKDIHSIMSVEVVLSSIGMRAHSV
jgi:hypothetical protein